MPLPMVHLSIAVKMLDKAGRHLSPDLLLGSIAPDSIHMRPDTGPQDKLCVHLADQAEHRLARARELLTQQRPNHPRVADFIEGYVAHILTDLLWQENVIEPAYRNHPQELSKDERWALYYQETSQIDIEIYHQMPWQKAVWSKLTAIQAYDFGSLLTSGEIGKWRDFVLGWYEGEEHHWEVEPTYITRDKTLEFIDRTCLEIGEIFKAWKASAWIDP